MRPERTRGRGGAVGFERTRIAKGAVKARKMGVEVAGCLPPVLRSSRLLDLSLMLKRTPLFAAHQKASARLIEFGGWEMPVQYSSIVDEHLAVRKAAGIFDISHMGEFCVSGASATAFLNRTLTNDIRKLAVGQGQYTQ